MKELRNYLLNRIKIAEANPDLRVFDTFFDMEYYDKIASNFWSNIRTTKPIKLLEKYVKEAKSIGQLLAVVLLLIEYSIAVSEYIRNRYYREYGFGF